MRNDESNKNIYGYENKEDKRIPSDIKIKFIDTL